MHVDIASVLPLTTRQLGAALALTACLACGSSPATAPTSGTTTAAGTSTPTVTTVPLAPYTMNVVLGRPTGSTVTASVLADAGTEVYIEYGATSGSYPSITPTVTGTGTYPVTLDLTGVRPDTRVYYRVRYRAATETGFRADTEHSVMTARPAGSTFTFGVQGDSHPERAGIMFNADLYTRNMQNVATRRPDFYLALGDDFSIEGLLDRNQLTQANVDALYRNQRTFFGVLGHSTPVFLVNGNHEQAAEYLLNGRFVTPYGDAPVFQGRARTAMFPLPASDGFYDADTRTVSGVGLLRDYYAWTWGDALFVTIDPYWHSPVPVDNGVPGVSKTANTWEATIGDAQYAWLKRVLESSTARYKFVFQHHVLGTFRGAAAIVHEFEWGGWNRNGTAYEFPAQRPRWAKPIHQLFKDTGVTIVFSGHDHVFAREIIDNIVYQSVPNPADNTYTAFNADAYAPARVSLPGASYDPATAVVLPDTGFLHVTVSPSGVTVSYIRAVLPGDDAKAGAANGVESYTYRVIR